MPGSSRRAGRRPAHPLGAHGLLGHPAQGHEHRVDHDGADAGALAGARRWQRAYGASGTVRARWVVRALPRLPESVRGTPPLEVG